MGVHPATGGGIEVAHVFFGMARFQSFILSQMFTFLVAAAIGMAAAPRALALPGSELGYGQGDSRVTAILIAGDSSLNTGAPSEGTTHAEGLDVIYDPNELVDAPVVHATIEQLRVLARNSSAYKSGESVDQVPLSTPDEALLENLKDFSPVELSRFLSRKQLWLARIQKSLQLVRLPEKVVARTITAINEAMFANAKLIMQANVHATVVGFGVSGGVGFSDWLSQHLRRVPYLKMLPERTGFWYALSVGIAISQVHENGWHRIRIEPVIDFRKATKIIAPFASAGAGVFLAQGIEVENAKTTPHVNFVKLGGFGVSHNENILFFSSAAGIGIGWSPFAVMSGVAQAYPLNRDGFSDLYADLKRSLRPVGNLLRPGRSRLACEAFLAAP